MKVLDLLEQRFELLRLGVMRPDRPVKPRKVLTRKFLDGERPGGGVRLQVVTTAQVSPKTHHVRLERPAPLQSQSAEIGRCLRGVVERRRAARLAQGRGKAEQLERVGFRQVRFSF